MKLIDEMEVAGENDEIDKAMVKKTLHLIF